MEGKTPASDTIIETDTLIKEPTKPVKKNYIFAGWYSDSTFTKKWDFSANKVADNIILYAKWEKNVGVENTTRAAFSLYPNPATNILNIQGQNLKAAKIFNLAGKELMRVELNNSNLTELNINSLISGYYIIRITDNKGMEEARSFVKK